MTKDPLYNCSFYNIAKGSIIINSLRFPLPRMHFAEIDQVWSHVKNLRTLTEGLIKPL